MVARYTATVIRAPGSVPRRAGRTWPLGATAADGLGAEQLAALRHTRGYSLMDIQECAPQGRAVIAGDGSPGGDGGDAQAGAPAPAPDPAPRSARRKRVAADV